MMEYQDGPLSQRQFSIYQNKYETFPIKEWTVPDLYAYTINPAVVVVGLTEVALYAKRELSDDEYEWRKSQLPTYSAQGIFYPRRRNEDIISITGIIPLDIDDLDNIYETEARLREIPYTLLMHRSASRKGLRVLAAVTPHPTPETYRRAEYALLQAYEVEGDPGANKLSQPMYIVHDEDAFYNSDARCLEWDPEVTPEFTTRGRGGGGRGKGSAKQQTQRIEKMGKGDGRTDLIVRQAASHKKRGVPMLTFLKVARGINERFRESLSDSKLESTVRDIYNRY